MCHVHLYYEENVTFSLVFALCASVFDGGRRSSGRCRLENMAASGDVEFIQLSGRAHGPNIFSKLE